VDPSGHDNAEANALATEMNKRVGVLASDHRPEEQRGWWQNFARYAAVDLPDSFGILETFKGLAKQDPVQMATGLALEAAGAVGGLAVKTLGPTVVSAVKSRATKAVGAVAEIVEEGVGTVTGIVKRAVTSVDQAVTAQAARADENLARHVLQGRGREVGAAGKIPTATEAETLLAGSAESRIVPPGELAPAAPPLTPGRTPLREFDIDLYKRFGGERTGDQLAGHEMLQNAWLKAHGHSGRRGVGQFSRNNPAVALSDDLHTRVGVEQGKLGLNDPARLKTMGAGENINLNAEAMRNAGVPEAVVQTLQKEALKHAGTLSR
jgi:hypothetical protein